MLPHWVPRDDCGICRIVQFKETLAAVMSEMAQLTEALLQATPNPKHAGQQGQVAGVQAACPEHGFQSVIFWHTTADGDSCSFSPVLLSLNFVKSWSLICFAKMRKVQGQRHMGKPFPLWVTTVLGFLSSFCISRVVILSGSPQGTFFLHLFRA